MGLRRVAILDIHPVLPYTAPMTKREAKKKAWYTAFRSLESLVGCGWPYEMQEDADAPESDVDLLRMQEAMQEIVQHCFDRSQ